MPDELTQKDFARMGAEATNKKYPKEIRSEWAKRGPKILQEKYGLDYYKKLAQKSVEARRKKKNEAILLS